MDGGPTKVAATTRPGGARAAADGFEGDIGRQEQPRWHGCTSHGKAIKAIQEGHPGRLRCVSSIQW